MSEMNETQPAATAAATEVLTPEIMPVNADDVARQLTLVQREAKMDDNNALAIRSNFAEFYDNIVTLRQQATTITNPTAPGAQKLARTVRLELKKNRCAVEAERKTLKAESLARGKFIDGVAGYIQTVLCEPVEERLEAIEKHAERMEAARIAAMIETRKARLIAEAVDPAPYNLAAMDDETFEIILGNARRAKAEADEAARKAEADRVAKEQAEAAERERIRLENERLKEEAKAREEAARVEREKAAAELARVEAERKREREEAEAKAKAERMEAERKQREIEDKAKSEREAAEKAKREADAKARAEREAAERALAAQRAENERLLKEAEAKAKAEREAKAATERAEQERIEAQRIAAQKAAAAPDREKIVRFKFALQSIAIPLMSTEIGKQNAALIGAQRSKFCEWLDAMTEAMG
jgi:hypothetical protein